MAEGRAFLVNSQRGTASATVKSLVESVIASGPAVLRVSCNTTVVCGEKVRSHGEHKCPAVTVETAAPIKLTLIVMYVSYDRSCAQPPVRHPMQPKAQ